MLIVVGYVLQWSRYFCYNAGVQTVSPASSRFTTPSPVPLPSPLSSSTSPRYLPQSLLSGDGARPVPLMEHIRRLRCGSGGNSTRQPVSGFPDHTAPSTTTVPPLANVGLKDLLLSNDDDELMSPTAKLYGSSEISPAESCTAAQNSTAVGHGTEGDRLFDRGKIFLSENVDRPDSSTTKRSKPAVLLMQLLSRPDDEADDDDVGGSSSSKVTSASPPASGTAVSNQSDGTSQSADKLDNVFENQASVQGLSEDGNLEEPVRNNLLRV